MSEREEVTQLNEAFVEKDVNIDEYIALQMELDELKRQNGEEVEQKGIARMISKFFERQDARDKVRIRKKTLLWLTFLLGGCGGHRFVLRQPGLGTLFSFVDKIVSSFAPMIAGVVFAAVGFADHNPVEGDIVTWELRVGTAFLAFGVIIIGLICNLIAMKFYPLTKEKMAEIQDEVAKIKAAALAE